MCFIDGVTAIQDIEAMLNMLKKHTNLTLEEQIAWSETEIDHPDRVETERILVQGVNQLLGLVAIGTKTYTSLKQINNPDGTFDYEPYPVELPEAKHVDWDAYNHSVTMFHDFWDIPVEDTNTNK